MCVAKRAKTHDCFHPTSSNPFVHACKFVHVALGSLHDVLSLIDVYINAKVDISFW